MSTITDIDSAFAHVALVCDNEINRRHNRLAFIGIAVAIVLATVGISLELWAINHMVSSFMDGLTNHLAPTQPHSVTSAR